MVGEKLFQTNLLSRLSHKVCRLLSSPVLLRKFTIEGSHPTNRQTRSQGSVPLVPRSSFSRSRRQSSRRRPSLGTRLNKPYENSDKTMKKCTADGIYLYMEIIFKVLANFTLFLLICCLVLFVGRSRSNENRSLYNIIF